MLLSERPLRILNRILSNFLYLYKPTLTAISNFKDTNFKLNFSQINYALLLENSLIYRRSPSCDPFGVVSIHFNSS